MPLGRTQLPLPASQLRLLPQLKPKRQSGKQAPAPLEQTYPARQSPAALQRVKHQELPSSNATQADGAGQATLSLQL
jgi:hypothetical protein